MIIRTDSEASEEMNDFLLINIFQLSKNIEIIETYSDIESSKFSSLSIDKLNSIDEIQSDKITWEDCTVAYFVEFLA